MEGAGRENANEDVRGATWRSRLVARLQSAERIIWLDVTDFVQYCENGNTTVSGIQRVAANLGRYADIYPVFFRMGQAEPSVLDPLAFRSLVELMQSGASNKSSIKKILSNLIDNKGNITLRRHDIFLIAGAFWIYSDYDYYILMKKSGILLSILVYDLIQIKNPEYVSGGASVLYCRCLVDLLALVDSVFTISRYVEHDVRNFIKDRLRLDLPVKAITLPTDLPNAETSSTAIQRRVIEIACAPFVLCVGTLEIRKNHIYLIRIWERLLQENRAHVPSLVLVGKWGWRIRDFREYIERSRYTDHWLHIVNGIGDADLAYLYRHALFTMFPSFAEGWGLPVGESLAYGKPCIASGVTSIPEVGGRFVRYIDPLDVEDGLRAVEETLADRDALLRWERDIETNFTSKSWVEYSQEFEAAIVAIQPRGSDIVNYRFQPGIAYLFGDKFFGDLKDTDIVALTVRMTRMSGWHSPEEWGVWSLGGEADLRLATTLLAGTDIQLQIRLHTPPSVEVPAELDVNVGGCRSRITIPTGRMIFVDVPCKVSVDGILDITFQPISDGGYVFGISGIGFCLFADAQSRLSLLESFLQRNFVAPKTGSGMRNLQIGGKLLGLKSGKPGPIGAVIARIQLELARYASRRERWEDAARHYMHYIRLDQTNLRVWRQLGHALKESGRRQEAQFAYEYALFLKPDDIDILYHLKLLDSSLE